MALFGLFGRKKSPIRTPAELAEFIDEQAFALVQEGIVQNVRARAGEQADRILNEQAFAGLTEAARWRTYPLGLAMVSEMIDGLLRPHADAQRALADETIDLVLGVFDHHPVPAAIGKNAWLDARSDLAMRLDHISTQPPRNVADIPSPYIKRYLAEMPSHTGMTHPETGAALDALKHKLTREREELDTRMDASAMAKALLAGGGES